MAADIGLQQCPYLHEYFSFLPSNLYKLVELFSPQLGVYQKLLKERDPVSKGCFCKQEDEIKYPCMMTIPLDWY